MRKLILLFTLISTFAQSQVSAWVLKGNGNATNSNTFLGTTTNNSLRFRTNNIERFTSDSTHGGIWNGIIYNTEPTYIGGTLLSKTKGDLLYAPISYTTAVQYAVSPLSITTNTISMTAASAVNSGYVTTGTQTFAGSKTVGSDFTVGGNITFSTTTNGSLSGSNARIPSHTSSNITFTNAGLTSIASANNGGVLDGHILLITNATGGNLTIVNNYTAAASGEAILTGDGDLTIPNNLSLLLNYESTANAWTVGNGGTFQPKLTATAPITLTSNTLTLTSTGTNSVVLSTGATLTTPTLGVASATSLAITGTAGNGFVSLTTQTANPSAPSSGTVLFSNSNSKLSWRGSANNFVKTFDGGHLSADRVYSLPDRAVTVDSLTTSTSTALNGIISANGSNLNTATIGTGLTFSSNTLSVNASQTQITAIGTITTGTWNATKIGLAYGGTNADLSGTGGASQVLKQVSSGAAITVGQLASSDLSDGTVGTGSVTLSGALTTYTPTWTNATVGNATVTAAYAKNGKKVNVWIKILTGSSTTFGSGAWSFSLPTTAANAIYIGGSAIGFNSGVAFYTGVVYGLSTTTVGVASMNGGAGWQSTVPGNWVNAGSGTYIQLFYSYSE